jgi:predicted amidohydrolase YtcJ
MGNSAHANGDKAIDMMLRVYERLQRNAAQGSRFRLSTADQRRS